MYIQYYANSDSFHIQEYQQINYVQYLLLVEMVLTEFVYHNKTCTYSFTLTVTHLLLFQIQEWRQACACREKKNIRFINKHITSGFIDQSVTHKIRFRNSNIQHLLKWNIQANVNPKYLLHTTMTHPLLFHQD